MKLLKVQPLPLSNVYNMVKMARSLFSVEPEMRYADFHERAWFNHILGSQDAEDGRVCYMVPVGRGVQHEYQDMQNGFTCCVGSSYESHALHAYGIYWDLFTPEEWKKRAEAYAAEQEKQKKLEAATVVFAQPGQMQMERDFNQQGEDTTTIQVQGRYGRRGTKWFSFDLPVDPSHPMAMVVTYSTDGPRRSFDILVDGKKVGEQARERRTPEQDIRFFDVEYALPAELVRGKQKVTVRFEARGGAEIGTVFGIRMIRADAVR
jgi:hypothetical protein